MNRNLYRIVFNVKRGQLMAVAETASASGKASGQTRGAVGGLPAVLRPVCFAVLAAMGILSPVTQAQIIADPSAPGGQRATILAAPNGVPLVNITTPTAAGVSRNTYSQFDVQRNGAILNNSPTAVQTQLGGFVQGNPWLATGPARVIVTEVNSANPSQLRGYIEVAGPRTELVIANPAGIMVNGAGFINASNITLTTGTPVFNSGGGIDSYRVQRGTVSVTGLGLDAGTTSFTDILARAVEINAGIWADQLRVTTGANDISAANPGSATPIAGTGPRPAFALDAGLLSGMYANSITFKSTEDGLGIVHKGSMGVTANALLQVNGEVNNQGTIQAANTQIQASGSVSNSGQMSAGQTLTIASAGALNNSAGNLSAARLDISAASLANRGGSIEQTGAQALSLQSQSVSNAEGGQIGQTPAGNSSSGSSGTAPAVALADGVLRISGALNNDAGRINAAGAMDLSASSGLNNDGGTLNLRQLTLAGGKLSNQAGTLRAQGDMRIEAAQVQNQGGSLSAEGQLQLSAAGINNQGGEIVQASTQDTVITVTGAAGVLDNTQGRIASNGQNTAVSAQTLVNTDGKLEHAGAGTLDISAGTLSGQRGRVSGNGAVNLSAGAVNLDSGSLTAAQLTVNTTTLSNRGGQISQSGTGQASITASQGMDNTGGAITSKGGAVLNAATLTNSQGRIAAEQNVAITATTQLDNTDGAVAAIQNLILAGGTVNNTRGTLQAGADATLTVGDIQNTAGSVYAGANLNTSAANVTNTGSFYAEGNQTLTASGAVANSGVVASQGNTQVTANSLQSAQSGVLGAGIKADGTLAAGGTLAITATQSLAANGQMLATGNATLSGASVDLAGSQASAANITATATAGDISTRNATLSTAGTLSLTAKAGNTRSLDNTSGSLSAGQLTLDVSNLNNQGGQIIQTGTGDTAITLASPTGTLDNSHGRIASNGGNLSLSSQTLTNTDGKIEHAGSGTLGLAATTVNGQRGQITGNGAVNVSANAINHDNATLTAQQLGITASTLSNRAGQISQIGTGQTSLTASQSIDNTGGTIASNGNTSVSTATLNNTQGRLTASQGATVTAGTQLNNTDGVLAAAQALTLAGGAVNNARGALQAGGNATLTVGDIQNTGGSIYAGANLGVTAANVGNTGSMYAAGHQTLNASGAVTNSGLIAAQGDTTVRANSLGSTAGSILGAGIKADGTLASGGNLDAATTQGLAANGQVLAAGNATLSGSGVDLSGGQVAAANISATAASGDISTRNATVTTAGTLSLTAKAGNSQTLNNSSGTLNAGQLTLDLANLNNQGGQIVQTGAGDTTITLTSPTGTLDNTSGRIAANSRNLTLAASTLTNTDGKLEHAGNGALGITASTLSGQRGQIASLGALTVNAGAINHDSASTTARQITIAAASLNNHAGEIIQTGTDATSISTTAALDNSAGKIASKGNTTVSAQSINNQAGLLQTAGTSSLNVTATAALDNSAAGQIVAGGAATLNAGTLNNNLGKVTAGTSLTATATGAVNNTQGLIAANGVTTVTAASLDNTRGSMASVQNNLSLTTTGATTNDSGRIEALGSTTLANAGLSNTQAAGQATAGSITGNTVTIQSNGQVLNNAQGTIAAVQGISLQTGALNNDKGLIQAGGALGINTQGQTLTNTNAAGHVNGAGGISSRGAMTLDTGALNNTAGFIGAKGALTANTANASNTAGGQVVGESTVSVTSTGFDNQGGQVQALGDVSLAAGTGTVNNTASLIRSAGTTSLSGASIINSNTLGANQGIEGNNVAVTASTIANNSGAIRADNNATLTSSGTVNNNAGLVSAGNTATVQDIAASPAARTLAVTNTAGTIIAGQNTHIKAASLGGDGKVLSRKDLKIDLIADFNNTGEVSAAANATITTLGTLTNSGTLQAGTTLDVTAATISNALAGKMAAPTLKLTATDVHTLINRGLIDSVNTQINTVTLNNLGTGRIYGDTVGIAATTINNDAENGVAATIAARQRLDIGATTVNNSNGALIFSAGTGANALNIGGALDVAGHATGQAGLISNSASTIESLGGMALSAASIQNTNPSFSYTLSNTAPVSKMDMVAADGTVYASDYFAWTTTGQYLKFIASTGTGAFFPVIGGQVAGSPYAAPIYKTYYEGPNAFEAAYQTPPSGDANNGFYYPDVLNYEPGDPVWALFGMAQPSNPIPGPRPVRTWVGSQDQGGFVDPTPEQIAAWEAASAPWQALQVKLDAFRAEAKSTLMLFPVKREYTEVGQTATTNAGTPGKILSSGAMTLNASSQLLNDNSQIIAGGTLSVTGQAVNNQATQITATISRAGSSTRFGPTDDDLGFIVDPYVQNIPQTITTSAAVTQSNAAMPGTGTSVSNLAVGGVSATPGTLGTPSAAARSAGIVEVLASTAAVAAPGGGTPGAIGGGAATGVASYGAAAAAALNAASGASAQSANATSANNTPAITNLSQAGLAIPGSQPVVIRTVAPNTVLPTASLFRTNPNPANHYIVETDPQFANYRNWLSSDYLLTAMSLDPAATQKRLGDGFYEQRLVNEQVALLTGRRFLDGYSTEEAQYQALMDAGKTFAQQYQLRPGIALSAAQMAALTSDIVWLVEQTVTLPDGSTTKALVPQVYARAQAGDLDGAGTLLAGQSTNLNLTGDLNNSGTLGGRSVIALTAETVNNLGGRISGNAVNVTANNDLNNIGGTIDAANALSVTAGRDLNVTTTTTAPTVNQYGVSISSYTGIDRVAGLYVTNPGGTLVASAGRDVNVIAGLIQSQGSAQVNAARDVNLGTVTQSSSFDATRDERNFSRSSQSQDIGSQVNAAGNATVTAGRDINATAATVNSTQGATTLGAGNNLIITAGRAQSSLSTGSFAESSDGFSSSSTEQRNSSAASNALGSRIGGNTVTGVAGNDLTVTGSNVISDAGTTLAAGNNLTIQAATNTTSQSSFKETKESGMLDGGMGITIGTRQDSTDQKATNTTAAASTIGSIGGDVSLQAGNAYKQIGSDVLAPGGNIDITAGKVDIIEARETSQSQTEQKFSQSGLSIGLSSPVVSAVQEAHGQISAMSQTGDTRAKALALASAVGKLNQAAQALENGQFSGVDPATGKLFTPNAADKAGGVSLTISLGSAQSQSNSSSSAYTARGSTVDAGGNVNIQATGAGQASTLTIQGSIAKAGNNLSLQADGDINLLAAKNTGTNTNSNSSSASSIGASIGLGSAGGVSYNASTSKSQGQGSGTDESYTNTQVQAGNTATLKSGADTTLRGAVVSANQIRADVGGNLAIESLQDKSTYRETNQSSGGSISLGANGIPTGGSLSSGKSNIDSNFQSVTEQSGLKAGDSGFQVSVAGNTDLKGGAITSTQSALDQARNTFTTGGSLTTSDIQNSASYSATGSGATIGVGSELNKSGMGIGDKSGEAGSTTQAAISGIAGNTAARTGDAETGIKPIFDRDAVRNDVNAQVAITTEFGKQAGKAVGDYAQQKFNEALASGDQAEMDKWKEGGSARLGLHAMVGALTGGLGGALGAASSQAVVPMLGEQITQLDVPVEIKQALVQVAGLAVGSVLGGTTGASSALNATAQNYLSHTQWDLLASKLKSCKTQSQCDQITKEFVALSATQDAQMRQACQDTSSDACRGHIEAALSGSLTQLQLVAAGDLPANYAAGADLNAQANRLARNVITSDIKAACLADASCRQKQDNINGVVMLGTVGLVTLPMLPSLGSAAVAWIVANPVTASQLGIITVETAAAIATGAVSPNSIAEGMFAIAAMSSIKFVGGAGGSKNLIGGTTIKTLAEATDTATARSAAQAQRLQEELAGMSKISPDTARDAYYLANTDQNLLKANKFDMNHVLSGEINNAGKATGYHAELAAEGSARIRPGSTVTQNANGTYTAQVDVFDVSKGVWVEKTAFGGKSTFFNPSWSQARIEYEVTQAFKVRQPTGVPNQWRGTSPSGIEIEGYTTPTRTTFYPLGN